MKAITITTNNLILLTEVKANGHKLYELIRNVIGGHMEHVYAPMLPAEYVMTVNEDGKLNGLPVNQIASFLYKSFLHGDYIVGDVIILKLGKYKGESDVVGLSDAEANDLMNKLSLFEETPVGEVVK